MKIVYSKKFVSKYKKLSPELMRLAEEKEKIFKNNPFDPRLRTHKLTGALKRYWAFSLDYKHRVIVLFESKNETWFISIGTHDIYKN